MSRLSLITFSLLIISVVLVASQECSQNETYMAEGMECGTCFNAHCSNNCFLRKMEGCYCKTGYIRVGFKRGDKLGPCVKRIDCPVCHRGGFHNCACAVNTRFT
ncbi:PREDICTED: uncharacterized protein LOC108569838 [Nicrophorus vespilloides]|uniref:Uncharacterized protein LOC108569838 n=1 Tax=Nicrophorus vespilloides TaxID=110193 RepID=A0ABM1NJN5_NICVS|nr:PREDICTED: uncharacterized protein LOC108569838 [Nicrophorus vespilloides]